MNREQFNPVEGVKDPLAMTNFRLMSRVSRSLWAALASIVSAIQAIIPPAILGGGKVYDIRAFSGLDHALSVIATQTATLYITQETAVTADTTIPSNISVVVLKGGGFTSSNASTLTIGESLSGPRARIFFGDLVVVFSKPPTLFPQWWGAEGDGSTADRTAINAALAAASSGGRVIFPDTGSDYMISDVLSTAASSKIVIEWEGSGSYIKLSQATAAGGMFSTGANADLTFINPRLDADNIIGQNGIGTNTGATVRIKGGHLRNFPVANDYTGGKPIASDGWGARLFVDGVRVQNCHSALSVKRDFSTDSSTDNPAHIVVNNIIAEDCDIFAYIGVKNKAVGSFDGTEISVSISNFKAYDCGLNLPTISAGTHGGVFLFDRATRVTIANGVINNRPAYNGSAAIQSVFRGRGREISVDNVQVNCNAVALINIDPVPDYAIDTSAMGNNSYNLTATGTYTYIFQSDLTDATHPNRFLIDSYIETRLTNDVSTSLVTAATRNGVTWLKTTLAAKVIIDVASVYNSSYTNMAAASAGLNTTSAAIRGAITATGAITAGAQIRANHGGGGGLASFLASSASPSYAWGETGVGTDLGNWDCIANASILTLRGLADDGSLVSDIWSVNHPTSANPVFNFVLPLTLDDDLSILTAGKGLKVAEGSNAKMGTATLSSGTVTVSTTAIASGDRVILTRQSRGSSTAIGSLELGAVTAATSFVINALAADATVETGDLSVVHWMIVTPA